MKTREMIIKVLKNRVKQHPPCVDCQVLPGNDHKENCQFKNKEVL